METEYTHGQIITRMALLYQSSISKRVFDVLSTITELEPGMETDSIGGVISNIEALLDGAILVISGKIGCGKTVASTAGALLYQHLSRCRIQYDMPPLEEEGRRAIKFKIISSRHILEASFSDWRDEYTAHQGCLVIDDLGREYFSEKGFGIAEWDYLFDCRYADKLPTIITTNLEPAELIQKYNQRVYDRLKECAIWIRVSEKSLRNREDEQRQSEHTTA